MAFLSDLQKRDFSLPPGVGGVTPIGLWLGQGSGYQAEVAVVEAASKPTQSALKDLWKKRKANRTVPLVVVALHGANASICGPGGEDCRVEEGKSVNVERLCRALLSQPDHNAAYRFLRQALPDADSPTPGLRNEGFLATHLLRNDLQTGKQWAVNWKNACAKAEKAQALRGRDLLKALGFDLEETQQSYTILKAGPKRAAVAVLVAKGEHPDLPLARFMNQSPASYAINKADHEKCDYAIVTDDANIRVYPVKPGVGVARRGRTETFVELNLELLPKELSSYLWLLASADALSEKGTLSVVLDDSSRYAVKLAENLRLRIYTRVIPLLAKGIADARKLRRATAKDLEETYHAALVLLFRLLFIAYAEDEDLLPYRGNEAYKRRSIKALAQDLHAQVGKDGEAARPKTPWNAGTRLYSEIKLLFNAVDKGDKALGVPPYNGGLFASDKATHPEGEILSAIDLPDAVFGPALHGLLIDQTADLVPGPVDFRAIGVREFGTIYEGLLESELAQAEDDLTTDKELRYKPAKTEKEQKNIVVEKGEFYLHNASGARKSSGSYYTKSFAVDHLLDHALEPALKEHCKRLEALGDDDAAKAFFDFKVADIAMGSGHFLVAAVDRIERALALYLADRAERGHALKGVQAELEHLRKTAEAKLKEYQNEQEIEDAQLLRRLIARRCIYGVDFNKTAVDLARLAIWIHTFVPGLPLSFLNHTLRHGNSLAGIGTLNEARDILREAGFAFQGNVNAKFKEVEADSAKLLQKSDATTGEVSESAKLEEKINATLVPVRAVFDVMIAARLDEDVASDVREGVLEDSFRDNAKPLVETSAYKKAAKVLVGVHAFHFPIAFPEVFARKDAGFDVILGNPPWQEATIERHAFWARHRPGLRAYSQKEAESVMARFEKERPDLEQRLAAEVAEAQTLRTLLVAGGFPGMGTGDPDVYKAFCWRFWRLTRQAGGGVGVVLPRSAWAAAGSQEFREAVLESGAFDDLTFLLNTGGWVFDEAEPRYTIALCSFAHPATGAATGTLPLRGPFSSEDRFKAGVLKAPTRFEAKDIKTWTETAALPLLPSDESASVFLQLRKAPNIGKNLQDSWRARPYTELHATADKPRMKFADKRPDGFVPVFKGESFDIWEPDRGDGYYYAWADPEKLAKHLQEKRESTRTRADSPWSEFPSALVKDFKTLPFNNTRIAFRDVTRATDSRTVRAALVPPRVFITNQAPTLLWPRGDEKDQAYLLGMLCSLPLDWYARRFVETHVNFHVFNSQPMPRPTRDDPLWKRVVEVAGRLACPDKRFKTWAEAVGVECGPLPQPQKLALIHELDALSARLYGLNEAQLTHIFETFHEGKIEGEDYRIRLEPVLTHFRRLAVR